MEITENMLTEIMEKFLMQINKKLENFYYFFYNLCYFYSILL